MAHSRVDTDPGAAGAGARVHWRSFLIRVAVVVACIALSAYYWPKIPWPVILPIKQVQISGLLTHLSPTQLETRVAQAIRGGFFNLSVADLKQELNQDGWVSEVTVRRGWPDSLFIHVTEHAPVALWGSSGLLSAQAAVFAPPPESFPAGLPFLNGPMGSEQAVLEKYWLLKTELAPRGMEIDTLVLTERRAWRFRLVDGPLVLVGKKDVEGRFARFFNFAIPHYTDWLSRAETVDMRYTNGFAVKWANGPENATSG